MRDSFFSDVIAPIVVIITLCMGFATLVVQLSEASAHDECHSNGELINNQVTYRKWDGCYVNQNGLWMPLEVYKFNKEHSLLK